MTAVTLYDMYVYFRLFLFSFVSIYLFRSCDQICQFAIEMGFFVIGALYLGNEIVIFFERRAEVSSKCDRLLQADTNEYDAHLIGVHD